MSEEKSDRRDFVKKATYVVPAVVSLKAAAAFARAASGPRSGPPPHASDGFRDTPRPSDGFEDVP